MSKENENIENSVGITVTFESLISEYAGTAMAYLGGMQDPETKKVFDEHICNQTITFGENLILNILWIIILI